MNFHIPFFPSQLLRDLYFIHHCTHIHMRNRIRNCSSIQPMLAENQPHTMSKKTVLITGCVFPSSHPSTPQRHPLTHTTNTTRSCTLGGIGHSLALDFHSRGYTVLASARTASKITDLAALGITTLSLDVTDKNSIEAAKREVEDLIESGTIGGLDVLVNNA